MLVLLASARRAVRKDRLERSNRMIQSRPPFDSMNQDARNALIREQTLIVQFAPDEALLSLPLLLKDDVDRLRAVNLVMGIAGSYEEMDPTTITMFKRIQSILRTMPGEWTEAIPDGVLTLPAVPPDHTDAPPPPGGPDHPPASTAEAAQ